MLPTFAPLLLHGAIDHAGQARPTDVLVVLNGQVAGVVVLGTDVGNDAVAFTALVAPDLLRSGANEVSFLVPTASGASSFAALLPDP